jgi:hypothetical protein
MPAGAPDPSYVTLLPGLCFPNAAAIGLFEYTFPLGGHEAKRKTGRGITWDQRHRFILTSIVRPSRRKFSEPDIL